MSDKTDARTGAEPSTDTDPESDGGAQTAADRHKARSRGVSQDMSPEAIARRIDIVSELRDLALSLGQARKTETTRHARTAGNQRH